MKFNEKMVKMSDVALLKKGVAIAADPWKRFLKPNIAKI